MTKRASGPEHRSKRLLIGLILLCAAGLFIGLTVYPYQYGFGESAIVVAAFVLLALYELLDSNFL